MLYSMFNFVYFSHMVFLHVYIISISDTEYEIIHFLLAQNSLLKSYIVEKIDFALDMLLF